jgi:uncharacterized RDD family membrane protein YckC
MAFCTSCGSQVDQDTRFCHKCGQPVAGTAPVASAAPLAQAPPATYAAQPAGVPPAYAQPPIYAQAPTSKYAGFWIRFVAYIVDGLIIGIPMSVVVSLIVFMFGAGTIATIKSLPNDPDQAQLQAQIVPLITALIGTYALLLLGGLVLGWLYFAMMESSARQATFGKAMLNLRVADVNGNRLSFAHASGRFFAKLVNSFTCGIGWIIAGFTEKKQGLHDLIAGTVVIRTL